MLLNEKRAKDFLETNNLNAIISSGRENTTYLTDFLAVEYIRDRMASGPSSSPGSGNNYLQTYGMFTRDGERALILPLARFLFVDPAVASDLKIYTYGTMMSLRESSPRFDTEQEREFDKLQSDSSKNFRSPAEALSAVVKELVKEGSVGLDYSDLHEASLRSLNENNSSIKIKNASESLRFLRTVKSKDEIRRLEKAVEITEKALAECLENAREGVSEMKLRSVFASSVSRDGALFEGAYMSPIGSRSGGIAAPSNTRKLEKGDIGWFDFGCVYYGYHSDTGESFCVGDPSERQLRTYEALKEVVDRSIEMASPGIKCGDLSDEVTKIWDKHGVTRPPTGMGHGIGLETHEYPVIASQGSIFIPKGSRIQDDIIKVSTDLPIEEGMVLNFEAPYMVWGWGGVHIEKTAVVEKSGCRLIAPQERHLRKVGSS